MDLLGKLLALLCAMMWAVAVILFKRAGDHIQPLALNWFKTAVTSLLLLPFLYFQGLGGLDDKAQWALMLSGILGIALSDTLFFIALKKLGASLTAIVDCFYAPFVMLASWLMLCQVPRMAQLGGALLVILAILVVAFDKGHADTHVGRRNLVIGFAAGGVAMALMGVSVAIMQPVLKGTSVFVATELRMLAALAVLTPMMLLHKERRELFTSLTGHGAWRHALPGTLMGNVLSMTLWVAAFKYTSTHSAAILNQLNTIFILILATWLLKEVFTRARLVGTILAFGGALLVLLG